MEKQSLYTKISSVVLTVFFALLPLFFLPYTTFTFFYAKVGLVALCVLIMAVVLIVRIIDEKSFSRPAWLYVGIIGAVPVAYLISAFFSKNIPESLIGQGVDFDTVFMVSLGMLLAAIVAHISRDRKQTVFTLGVAFSGVALVVTLFHLIRFIFGANILSLGLFTSSASNTIGSLGDLGIYAGLALIISIISLEFLTFGAAVRAGFYALTVSSLAVVVVTNFNFIGNLFGTGIPISLAFVLMLCALIVFVHKKVIGLKGAIPYVACAVFVVLLLCTVEARVVSNWISPLAGVKASEMLDVRPSPGDSIKVAENTLTLSPRTALVGVGPNRYFTAWDVFKPTDPKISTTPESFKQSDFSMSFSYISTSLVTEGLLGFLAWIFFFIVLGRYVYMLFRKVVKSKADPLSVYSSATVSISTIFLWIAVLLYTPGPVIIFLAFIFTGLLFGRLMAEDIISVKVLKWDEVGYWKSFSIVFSLVVAMAVIISVGYVWSIEALASSYAQKAVNILAASGTSPSVKDKNAIILETKGLMQEAIKLNLSSEYLRLYSEISLVRPSDFIKSLTAPVVVKDIPVEVAADVNNAFVAADYAATNLDKGDYRNWIELGKVHETATFLGATSSADLSVQAYLQAETLNPTSPLPPFLVGRILMLAGRYDIAVQQLTRALQLNPNYTDARALLDSATAALNKGTAPVSNVSTAVNAAPKAASTSVKTKTNTKK